MKYRDKLRMQQIIHDEWADEFEGQYDHEYIDKLIEETGGYTQAAEHALEIAATPEAEQEYVRRVKDALRDEV